MWWQFNEIWPTGGWGTIEYGTPGAGQVLGGRWKPMQYWYKRSVYADVMASCGVQTGGGGVCYVKNDGHTAFSGQLNITTLDFKTGTETLLVSKPLHLAAGPGITQWLPLEMPTGYAALTQIMRAVVVAGDGTLASDNVIPLSRPADMAIENATVAFSVASAPNADGSVDVAVHSDHVAVFVTLTTRAHGRFSDNAFLLLPSAPLTLQFVPFGEAALDMATLKSSLRVEHLASYV